MSLNITAEHFEPEKSSFWRRQFAGASTEPQAIFDFVFCLLAPILCFYFDPVVFKGGLMGKPVLQSFQLFAYGVTAVEIAVFLVWILVGERLGAWSRLIGGTLISGAVFSAVIGFAILPYSVLGLMVLIGVLGFIPFLTAFAYLRIGWRALRSPGKTPAGSSLIPLLAGAILSLALPALVSLYVSQATTNSVNAILYGNNQQAELAVGHLRRLPFIPQQKLDALANAYSIERDPARKERLKNSYQALTGENLERRIAIIND
ncbi:MAG TPA: hypothetical protein VGN90_08595 [Pyrinomonadaceae bacterium]|jgi:hypothetical protein|nr:hypothetical protein [Pyrinomonadaceae bacterium]